MSKRSSVFNVQIKTAVLKMNGPIKKGMKVFRYSRANEVDRREGISFR